MLKLQSFKGGFDNNFSYIIYDPKTKDAAIIDTSINPKELMQFIEKNRLKLNYAIIMHSHFDHLIGYSFYRKNKIRLLAHESFKKEVDKKLIDNEELNLGNNKLKVMHTPGHIYDSICILVENKLFTSDTLFINSCGRFDLPGSSEKEMYNSLYNKILKLPDETIVYPGHDYGNKPKAKLKELKKTNFYLQFNSEKEFINQDRSFVKFSKELIVRTLKKLN